MNVITEFSINRDHNELSNNYIADYTAVIDNYQSIETKT